MCHGSCSLIRVPFFLVFCFSLLVSCFLFLVVRRVGVWCLVFGVG